MDNFNCEIERDIVYRELKWLDSQFSTLNIYYRDNKLEGKTVIIFVHGGSWSAGDKDAIEKNPDVLSFFLALDFVVVSINFRLVDMDDLFQIGYRQQAEDIVSAIKWLSENVSNYGGSNNQFILLGYSSGAHLAALVATDTSYLNSDKVSVNIIRAVIALDVHAYDVPLAIELMKGTPLEKHIPSNEAIFGKTRQEQMKGSPSSFVLNSKVPFLLVSAGRKDGMSQTLSREVTESFKRLLTKSGHMAIHVHLKSRSHRSIFLAFNQGEGQLGKVVTSFIEQVTTDEHGISTSAD